MSNQKKLSFKLEMIWWVFTIILLVVVLFPVYNNVTNYPFWGSNILFIIAFITLSRYIFLLRHTFLAENQKIKVLLFFLSIPVVFFLISQVHYFQTFLDEKGVESFLGEMNLIDRNRMTAFIRTEMLFFGIGSVVTAIIFPFRMLGSVWLLKNRGTV
jgi:FlaA1/EpsC-like NDP-sugar epimerase